MDVNRSPWWCWLLLLIASPVAAQEWAEKMFSERSHDFGVVARGAKAEFRFEFQNIFQEDVHIVSVESSCSCTTPVIENDKRVIKTWDKGAIVAVFNTRQFTDDKGAKVKVRFDKPFAAVVELSVKGKIRGDVVFEPAALDFGKIDLGGEVEKKLHVSYAGNPKWEIRDVRSALPIEVNMFESARKPGRVEYDLVVKLSDQAPSGYFTGQMTLVTSDPHNSDIPVTLEGRIVSGITVSASHLMLGALEPGQTVTRKVVLSGRKEFKITEVKCDDEDGLKIVQPSAAKRVQVIPVTYTAGDAAGKLQRTIVIKTDQDSEPVKVHLEGEIIVTKNAQTPAPQETTTAKANTRPRTLTIDPRAPKPVDANEEPASTPSEPRKLDNWVPSDKEAASEPATPSEVTPSAEPTEPAGN
jgi:hypothetical protein